MLPMLPLSPLHSWLWILGLGLGCYVLVYWLVPLLGWLVSIARTGIRRRKRRYYMQHTRTRKARIRVFTRRVGRA